jgi:UDP-2,4-diacetamido-2,4,6-trideoxy-beta-L-altropyranose hydrolase
LDADQPGLCLESGMISARQLLIRADASPKIGAGHVMRCLALSKAWQFSGGDVTFACAEVLPTVQERLQQEGFRLVAIEDEPGNEQDAQRTGDLAKQLQSDWVVVDGYRFAPDFYRRLRGMGLRSLAIDDDGRFDGYVSDAVLNQNASATETMYRNRQGYTKLLLGSSFVLLRPEFARTSRERATPQVARKLLITMGGSDPENVTMKVVAALSEISDPVEIRVVLGSGYRHAAELRTLVSNSEANICFEENPRDMVPLMAWADLAISAAGGTCWELAYMGVPAVVIAISRDQCGIAEAVATRGVAYSLGSHAHVCASQIIDIVHQLMIDPQRRSDMSIAGQRLIDGLGPKRVVDFLQSAA